jgi:hypothetical protein
MEKNARNCPPSNDVWLAGWLAAWLLLQSAVVASSRRRHRPSIVVLCGASCGAPTVGIVQTALCAMLRGGDSATAFLFIITTTTRWEGTHQSIHIYMNMMMMMRISTVHL